MICTGFGGGQFTFGATDHKVFAVSQTIELKVIRNLFFSHCHGDAFVSFFMWLDKMAILSLILRVFCVV